MKKHGKGKGLDLALGKDEGKKGYGKKAFGKKGGKKHGRKAKRG